MLVTKDLKIGPIKGAPHPCIGKIVAVPADEAENNRLAGFVEYGPSKYSDGDVSVMRYITETEISFYASARTPEKLEECLNAMTQELEAMTITYA